MKSLTVIFISVLLLGQVLGHQKPRKDEEQSFESDEQSSKRNELRHDNNKYRFNFAVQEPEPPKTEDEDELKSFTYKVKSPVTENRSKIPVEQEPAKNPSQNVEYSRDDNVSEDKPGCKCGESCTCSQNPCTCQHGNCPFHTNGFVLPVQYESDGDYVEYDYPERYRRQSPHPLAGVTGMVGQMTGQITGAVQNVANSFGGQRPEQGQGFFAPASGFSPEQRQGRLSQVSGLVGQITGRITDAMQNTMNGQQSEQQPGILSQAQRFRSEQNPQLSRVTGSVGDITGHITGVVRDTTQQAAQLMNQFTMRRDDPNRQKRSVNNFNERESLNFVESVRRGRQLSTAVLERFRQSVPEMTDMLSNFRRGENSNFQSQMGEVVQRITGRSLSELTPLLGSSRDQQTQFLQDTAERLGMSQNDPLRTHLQKLFQGIRPNGAQGNSRKKRSVYTTNEWYERQIPVLQVKERPNENIENFKRLSESRVELYAPECLKHSPEHSAEPNDYEQHNKCNKCGTHLTGDTMCESCGAQQSQYFEYVNGEPVSYNPKTTEKRSSESTNEPRYVFDRYGHRYLEHNGNLRLMAPESYRDEVVGSSPNYSGLLDILNQNRDVMHDLNRNGPRMIPRPSEYVQDTIRYIHDLARRDTKRTDSENKKSGDPKKKLKSIYQILPIRYDGKNGEMVMKVYSAKDREAEYRGNDQQTNVAVKSKPTVRKFRKNRKEYDIVSFDNNSKRHE